MNLQKDSNLNHSDESFTELTESDSFTELQVIIKVMPVSKQSNFCVFKACEPLIRLSYWLLVHMMTCSLFLDNILIKKVI